MDPTLIKLAIVLFWSIFLLKTVESLYGDFAASLLGAVYVIACLSLWATDHLSGAQKSHLENKLQVFIVIVATIALGQFFAKIALPFLKKLKSSEE